MPFMDTFHQEVMFVLAPKSLDYTPTMDPIQNSRALKNNHKTVAGWEHHEYNLTKYVDPG